jgi:hypothetical protein
VMNSFDMKGNAVVKGRIEIRVGRRAKQLTDASGSKPLYSLVTPRPAVTFRRRMGIMGKFRGNLSVSGGSSITTSAELTGRSVWAKESVLAS